MPSLKEHPIHLGLGATAVVEPPLDGMQWYADYATRHAEDGSEGPGVWHTADVRAPATALFITAGAGTEHRPR